MEHLLTDTQFRELYAYLASEPVCNSTLKHTIEWLREHHSEHLRANIQKIIDLGGHCDCEVLMNVTPGEWARCKEDELIYPAIVGIAPAQEFISELMLDSAQMSLW